MQDIVQVRDVDFSYGTISVLHQLNFSLKAGEWIGIQGANGAGKSTILHLLLGQFPVQKGEILLFGVPVEGFTQWEKVALVRQTGFAGKTHFPASVEEIVAMPLYWRRKKDLTKDAMNHKVKEALATVHMEDFAKRQLNQLSGGQQQRVQLAQALVGEPDLLLLDEPTTGLDKKTTKELDNLFSNLRQERRQSALLISHDLNWLSSSVDRIFHLEEGQIVPVEGGSHATE